MLKKILSVLMVCVLLLCIPSAINAASYSLGDVNLDGNVNGKDVLSMRKGIVGLSTIEDVSAADMNFDGNINGKDVLVLRKVLIGLIPMPEAPSLKETLIDWEGDTARKTPSNVDKGDCYSATIVYDSNYSYVPKYSIANTLNEDKGTTKLLTIINQNQKNCSPLKGNKPAVISFEDGALCDAVGLEVSIHIAKTNNIENFYIGFVVDEAYYYAKLYEDCWNNDEFRIFTFNGIEFTKMNSEETMILDSTNIKNIDGMAFWVFSDGSGSSITVDGIRYATDENIILPVLDQQQAPIIDTSKKYCALTFDDGPSNALMSKILDALEENDVPATFFLVGEIIENNSNSKELIERAAALGCEFGNHSYSYSVMNGMSAEEVRKSISDTNDLIASYTGSAPKYFRAPNLATSSTMRDVVEELGMTFITGICASDWTATTDIDFKIQYLSEKCVDGQIILIHDLDSVPTNEDEVARIIPILKSMGYEFVTLTDLFEVKNITPEARKDYYVVK